MKQRSNYSASEIFAQAIFTRKVNGKLRDFKPIGKTKEKIIQVIASNLEIINKKIEANTI